MDNLNEVDFQLDEETQQIPQQTPTQETQPPVMDFFNSAGNTKLENEEPEDKTEDIATDKTDRPKGKIVLGKVISGKSAVTLVNIFIPSFIVFALNRFGYEAQKSQLKLTTEEKEMLNPVVQDCLDFIEINFDNPFYALGFVASMIYGSKIFDIVPDLKRIKDDISEPEYNEKDIIEHNPDYKEPIKRVERQYIDVRKRLESTSIRKERNKIIIEALEQAAPKDLIEAWAVYGAIFPERNESYFRNWHSNNIELFPESLKFNESELL